MHLVNVQIIYLSCLLEMDVYRFNLKTIAKSLLFSISYITTVFRFL